MWMLIAISVVAAIVVVTAVAFLIRFIARSSTRPGHRTMWLAIGLIGAVFVATIVSSYASIYYRIPPGWIVAAVVAWAGVVTLMVLIAIDVRWRPTRLLAIAGLFVAAMVGFALLGMSVPSAGSIFPFETAAKQIGEANGFVVLLPSGQEMNLGSKPIAPLDPDKGLWVDYEGFSLEERKASGADLAGLVAPGSVPTAGAWPIPTDATTSSPMVGDATAYAVEYTVPEKEGAAPVAGAPGSRVSFLVVEKGGVDIRLFSESYEQLQDGKWVTHPNLSMDELAKIAESMQPVQ
jgi:hypothetical protein